MNIFSREPAHSDVSKLYSIYNIHSLNYLVFLKTQQMVLKQSKNRRKPSSEISNPMMISPRNSIDSRFYSAFLPKTTAPCNGIFEEL